MPEEKNVENDALRRGNEQETARRERTMRDMGKVGLPDPYRPAAGDPPGEAAPR